MNRQQLIEQIKEKRTFLCVGLDPDIKKIPQCIIKACKEELEDGEEYDDSLAIKMSEASLLTMKVVKQDTTSVIVLHRTYYTKGNQHATVTQTFDSYWHPLSKPVVVSTLLKRDDEVKNLPHF